ncbi:hypothetical protein K9M79_06890 [Candidatus Woesearchaeota archaeon]|nr:hypothetical protein [Candidatus Woesearchaeota archaeon]
MGCSGGLGTHDWALASKNAGFSFLTCPVMIGYLAVPYKNRPIDPETGKQYEDEVLMPGVKYYHDPILQNLSDSIYPRRLENTKDLIVDE